MIDADILDRLYSGDAEGLQDGLALAAARIGADSINIRLQDLVTGAPVVLAVHGDLHTDSRNADAYFNHWYAHDVHAMAARRSDLIGRVVADDALITPAQAARDPYIQDFYIPAGCGPVLGSVTRGPDAEYVIGAVRHAGRTVYDSDDLRAAETLQPHLHRALLLAKRLRHTNDLALALTHEGAAVLRCDALGRVLFVASGAEAVLAGARGVRLTRDGLVWRRAQDATAFARLTALAAHRAADVVGAAPLIVPDGERMWLRITAAPTPGLPSHALVVIRRIGHAPRISAAALKVMFGLSDAEARVALEVAGGRHLPAIARDLGVGHETVRTQLGSVFTKVGVRRQSELAALIAKLG